MTIDAIKNKAADDFVLYVIGVSVRQVGNFLSYSV